MILGIDLGTSNSLICQLQDGQPVPIPNALGEALTPSVVALDESGTLLVGAAAREHMAKRPLHAQAAFKRHMGSSEKLKLGDKTFRPEDLSALVLSQLKRDAEAALGQEVKEVVISVPAYFTDKQRKATLLAGELAGLKVVRLLNEPTAAALAHGIKDRDDEATFLVFDLGGGTFDVSILERFSGVMEVRATGGDSYLGGEDFTDALAQHIAAQVGLQTPMREDLALRQRLRQLADKAKRQLTFQGSVDVDLAGIAGATQASLSVSQAEFEKACELLLARLRAPLEQALRDARIRVADLDEVVLVGGATRMPMIRRLVSQLFGRLPARLPDPDQTVGLGAAICAGMWAQDEAFQDVVMTDVCPHTLGTKVSSETAGGGTIDDIFLPILERNTVVPASRVCTVVTARDQQRQVMVQIYQGEHRFCRQNVLLGELEVDVPPRPAGEVKIDIRYTYDLNGVLDVDVAVPEHGIQHNLLIKRLAGDVSDEEIAERRELLRSLKVHPRDQSRNRLVLERAERLYQTLLGDRREVVGRWLLQFEQVLNNQDARQIDAHCRDLSEALDRIEGDPMW